MIFDRDELERLCVYTLRNVAREVGVKAPTTLKKSELINEIERIQRGEKQAKIPDTRGRPVKSLIGEEKKIIDSISEIKKNIVKKDVIEIILKEIERKLYEILL